jgi:hypothetical protein
MMSLASCFWSAHDETMTSINLPRHHEIASVPVARRVSLPSAIRRLPQRVERLRWAFADPASPTEEALHSVRHIRSPQP